MHTFDGFSVIAGIVRLKLCTMVSSAVRPQKKLRAPLVMVYSEGRGDVVSEHHVLLAEADQMMS